MGYRTWFVLTIDIVILVSLCRILAPPLTAEQRLFVVDSIPVQEQHYSSSSSSNMANIPYDLLSKQNAETSNALIDFFSSNEKFLNLSKFEGDLTVSRDKEDGEKLQVGIDYAKDKGVIDPNFVPEPYIQLDVLGRTPDQVADEIMASVKSKSTEGDNAGLVIVLCGLSGTGKGTTVAKLKSKLGEETGKPVVTWSNGNIFRSVTYLAATWCEHQEGIDGFDAEKALTKENLASFMTMLSFDKFDGHYDTHVKGLGVDMLVSKVQNTELKTSKVSKNIPTVAQQTQGEVIIFASKAVETLKEAGQIVLLEGREQTVNYVRTPHRFTLVLSDESLIGKRRAAQRLMAEGLKGLPNGSAATEADVATALNKALEVMVGEIGNCS